MPDNLPATKQLNERQEALIQLMLANTEGRPIKELAVLVGYSKNYADGPLYQMINGPSFKAKLLEQAKAQELSKYMPKLMNISDKALDEYSTDPRLAIEKPALLRQLRQDVNLSKPEEKAVNQTINIQSLTVIRNGLRGYIEDDIQDAEVVS